MIGKQKKKNENRCRNVAKYRFENDFLRCRVLSDVGRDALHKKLHTLDNNRDNSTASKTCTIDNRRTFQRDSKRFPLLIRSTEWPIFRRARPMTASVKFKIKR